MIEIQCELRPCRVRLYDGRKVPALFHAWTREGFAIVERDFGAILSVETTAVEFLDSVSKFDAYLWPLEIASEIKAERKARAYEGRKG